MVIKQVKHWMKLRANAQAWKSIVDWAEARGASFTQMEEGEGFVIDKPAPKALRIEWGPSQRIYIEGPELRLRWELGVHPELQMMVMERALRDVLERAVFEAYTDTLQTRIDTDTPEEMRWLVMFAQAEGWKSKPARARFSSCAITKELAGAWVEADLGEALALAGQDLVPPGTAFVMLVQRGNLYLRMAATEVDAAKIQQVMRLAEVAAAEAGRVSQMIGELGAWPTTSSAAWQHSTRAPEDPPPEPAQSS